MIEVVADLADAAPKAELLAALVPRRALVEVEELRRHGVQVSVGRTDDVAYLHPDAIRDTFVRLHHAGLAFHQRSGAPPRALGTLASVASRAPGGPIRRWGRRRTQARRALAESARSELLYDLPDVMGWAWHRQNGRATALITIVDAHELDTHESVGTYPRMSGRLDPSVLETTFGSRCGWLQGMSLVEAAQASFERFGRSPSSLAADRAESEVEGLRLFLQAPTQPGFKQIVKCCVDGLGIRSRKEEVRLEIERHAQSVPGSPTMLSIGCGTALPMLEVLQRLTAAGRTGHLVLIDQDPMALAAAQHIAEQMGLAHAIEIHCEQLFIGRGRATRVLDPGSILGGRQVDVCEDSGLREYFPDFLYRDLARKAWDVVKPGGLMTTGNMNVHRPQPEFLEGLMGWPIPVRRRSITDVRRLHLQAGLPSEVLRMRLTQDGVYAMCFATKPVRV